MPLPIRILFVANRGEIAVRIIRAAKELGIAHGAGGERGGPATCWPRGWPTRSRSIGPPHATKSYLNKEAIAGGRASRAAPTPSIRATASSRRTPISPTRSRQAGLVFVGPRAETIRAMGDKATAREIAAQRRRADRARVRRAASKGVEAARRVAAEHRLSRDDQGRGRRRRARHPRRRDADGARGARSRRRAPRRAPRSATAAFTSSASSARARHIEVQVLGDGEDVDPSLRARMLAAAPPAESLGGGARRLPLAGPCARRSAPPPCGSRESRRLSRRRHARISLRRGDAANSSSSR